MCRKMIISAHVPQLKAEHEWERVGCYERWLEVIFVQIVKAVFHVYLLCANEAAKLDLKKTVVSTHSISFHRGKAWKLQI